MSGLEIILWVFTAWAFGWAGYTAYAAIRVDCPFSPHWRVGLVVMALAEFAFGVAIGAVALDVHLARMALQ